jgi:hypothetical protein
MAALGVESREVWLYHAQWITDGLLGPTVGMEIRRVETPGMLRPADG